MRRSRLFRVFGRMVKPFHVSNDLEKLDDIFVMRAHGVPWENISKQYAAKPENLKLWVAKQHGKFYRNYCFSHQGRDYKLRELM